MPIRIKARPGESAEQMMRRFKKLCEKEGLTKDVKRREYYEKPSERKQRSLRKSIKRAQQLEQNRLEGPRKPGKLNGRPVPGGPNARPGPVGAGAGRLAGEPAGRPMIQRKKTRRSTAKEEKELRRFVVDAARLMADLHCKEVLIYDMHGLSDVTDYILLGTGTSDRQIGSVADDVEDLAKTFGLSRFGRDADRPASWVVLDLVSAVVHLFDPHARAHYDLEMMLGHAPRVEWKR